MTNATRRKPTAVRRREIAIAALAIVGREGVTALSTSALAKEVGLTTGALFRHYDAMGDIWEETVRYAAERLEGTFPDPMLPAAERLRALAEARVKLLRSEPGIAWLIRSPQAGLALPAPAVAALKIVVQRSRAYLSGALREGVADGTFRSDPPVEVLIVPFTATVHALVGQPSIHAKASTDGLPGVSEILDGLFELIREPSPTTVESPHG